MNHARPIALLMVGACLLAACPTVWANEPATEPQPKQHPYLYFDQHELTALKRRFQRGRVEHYRQAVLAKAEAALKIRDPDRRTDHNKFPDSVQSLLWAYHLTGDAKYREGCLDWIGHRWDRQQFPEWSEMGTAAIATAYDTLYPELTEPQKQKMKGYLERALDQHMRNAGKWHYNNPSNTVPTQCGAAGMAALALYWESPKAPKAVNMTVNKMLKYAHHCFSPEGGYIEGSLYWDFGVSYYLAYAHALRNTTGDRQLLDDPRLTKQHRFVETILGGDGQMMPFNDTQPRLYGLAVFADLGTRHERDLLLWLADFHAGTLAGEDNPYQIRAQARGSFRAFAVMFRGDRPGPPRFPGVPTLSVLEKQQWGAMRSSGDFVPNVMVGVKGSAGQLSHHKQNDLGSFIVYAGGEMMLLDPGYFQNGATEHTVPLINGKGPGRNGSKIVEAWERGPWRVMTIDSTRAYRKAAQRVRRTLVLYGDEGLVVLDDILPSGGAKPKITAQYQVAHKPEIGPESRTVHIPGHDLATTLWTFGPALKLAARPRDFGKSWHYNKLAKKGRLDWHTVDGEYDAAPNQPLVTVLVPGAKSRLPTAPRYQQDEESIEVSLSRQADMRFQRVDGQWKLTEPAQPATPDP